MSTRKGTDLEWKRFKASDSAPEIFVPEYYSKERNIDPIRISLKNWPGIVTAVVQAATLLVVAAGYLLTVRPVFQYQLLQEKTARLEIERAEIETEIEELREQQLTASTELESLEDKLQQERARGERIQETNRDLQAKERGARNRAESLRAEVDKEQAALEKARWELLMYDLLLMNTAGGLQQLSGVPRYSAPFSEFLEFQAANWPNPYQILVELVDVSERQNSHEFPEDMFRELRAFISEKEPELVCAAPDFEQMKENYDDDFAAIDDVVAEKTEARIREIVDGYEERGELVKITEEFRESTEHWFRATEESSVQRKYRDEVSDYRGKCSEMVFDIIGEISKLGQAEQ